MGAWISGHWFDIFQTTGIVASFLVAAYTTWKDERARKIGNSIAINQQYRETWKELFRHPRLARVFAENTDVEKEPVSVEEETFVKMLISHLSTVYRAWKQGEFVKLEGSQKDVQGFFTLPIPKAVWEKFKPLQDEKFAAFVEDCLLSEASSRQ